MHFSTYLIATYNYLKKERKDVFILKTKVLLIDKKDKLGNGLANIRTNANKMIDISAFEAGFSDSTSTTTHAYIIKDNVTYRIIRNYFDLDKQERVYIAVEDVEPYDVYPIPEDEK